MRLINTTQEASSVDPRTRDSTRQPADNSSQDNSPPFDNVLAEVGTGAKAAQPDTSVKKTAPVQPGAPTTGVPDATAGGDATIIDAFVGMLGKGATPTATTTATVPSPASISKGAASDGSDANPVDSLLKRMASKDDAATDGSSASSNVPNAPASDLISILMLGSAAAPTPPPPAAAAVANAAAAVAGASVSAAGIVTKDRPTAPSVGGAPSTDSPDISVSDISVSTHLTPVARPTSLPTAPSDTKAAAIKPANAALDDATSSGGSAPRAEADQLSTSRHEVDPAVTTPSLPMGADFGAVRDIASAIGSLASEAAPVAATVPDAPTATPGVARTMTLQMNPADLGTVDIRMHMTGQTLDVQLTISNPQTLGVVSRERDTLTSALQGQNYELHSLVIQDGGAAASSGGNNAATQGDSSSGYARSDRQSTGGGAESQGGGRQGQGAGRTPQDDRQTGGDARPRPSVPSRSGALFV
jgi:flagellar hook-length control protein FliK